MKQKTKEELPKKIEPNYSASFLHNSQGLSEDSKPQNSSLTHRIRLYIGTTSPSELNEIESVTYNLHETFEDPRITITNPKNGFELFIDVWGQFEAEAIIRYKNGSELIKNRYLSF